MKYEESSAQTISCVPELSDYEDIPVAIVLGTGNGTSADTHNATSLTPSQVGEVKNPQVWEKWLEGVPEARRSIYVHAKDPDDVKVIQRILECLTSFL